MHGETGILTKKTADLVNATRRAGGRVIAVGSTSLRLLESAAAPDGTVAPFEDETDLFISPGYRFKAVDLFSPIFTFRARHSSYWSPPSLALIECRQLIRMRSRMNIGSFPTETAACCIRRMPRDGNGVRPLRYLP